MGSVGIQYFRILIPTVTIQKILRQHTFSANIFNRHHYSLTHETFMIWRKVFGVFCFKIIEVLRSKDLKFFRNRSCSWPGKEFESAISRIKFCRNSDKWTLRCLLFFRLKQKERVNTYQRIKTADFCPISLRLEYP